MEKVMLGILVLSGLFHFSSSVRRQYYFINNPTTWPAAQKYCRDNYVDLATVDDWSETMELARLVSPGVPFVSMGLCRNWGWSVANITDFKEGILTYSNWESPAGWQLFCGVMSGSGQWSAINCSIEENFFCYNESVTELSARFTLVGEMLNWTDAQSYCRSVDTDLAKIQNQLENAYLQQMVGGQVWIGLTGLFWLWSDGSTPSFVPWKPLEPLLGGVQDCTALDLRSDVGMLSLNCYSNQPFFCYNVVLGKYFVKLQLTTENSSVNMTDPAVIESILTQMEVKLREKIGSPYVNLLWTKLPAMQTT